MNDEALLVFIFIAELDQCCVCLKDYTVCLVHVHAKRCWQADDGLAKISWEEEARQGKAMKMIYY